MRKLWTDEVEARIRKEARNLDAQTVPEKVQMCTKCVITNQRPRIVFDDKGVCSACRYAERKANGIDWDAREGELSNLLDKHRGSGAYDVIVPCSGGKDSAYVAHILKHEYGMNPLCARWAPHMITDIGERNWQSFIHSGYDTVTAQPNGLLHRKLARLGLEFYGDPFLPFIYGQLAWPMHVAAQNNVSLVFYGENGESEYGGDPSAENKPCWNWKDFDRIYMKGAAVDTLIQHGLDLGAITDDRKRCSKFYKLPPFVRNSFHWLGYYKKWHPMENFYLASEHTGFEPNEERSEQTYTKFASIDDRLDGLHYYLGYLKFGIGRCSSDAAQQVRQGELTRDEALALVAKYDNEFPVKHIDECLEYLGLDHEHLGTICSRFASSPDWT